MEVIIIMMNFKKHEIALQLQKTLKDGFFQSMNTHWHQLDDIALIYDDPICLCLDLLSLYHHRTNEPSLQHSLLNIQTKYLNQNHKSLTSISENDMLSLIHDMQKMNLMTAVNYRFPHDKS